MKTSLFCTIFLVLSIGTKANDNDDYCECLPNHNIWGEGIIQPKNNTVEPECVNIMRECGKSNPHVYGSEQISTNLQSQYAEFPWMIEISSQVATRSQTYNYLGGGSLIHPSVVLTAAHKVIDKLPQKLRVRAGEWDRTNTNEIFPVQDRQVIDTIIHEQYNRKKFYNGIALLFLDSPMNIERHISTVCLRKQNYVFNDNSQCFVSGWGTNPRDRQTSVSILKKVAVPLVPSEECEQLLRQTVLGNGFHLHGSFLCAGGEANKDTCVGDGGSPLVCRIPNSQDYYQAGIVTWGISCGQENVPGGYIDVTKFSDWIKSKISNKYRDFP